MNEDEVVQRLKIARRELDSLYPAVQMIDDWKYDNANKLWYYHISISVETENRYFPITSQWYVVVEPTYPQGKDKFFPTLITALQQRYTIRQTIISLVRMNCGEVAHYALMSILFLPITQSHFLSRINKILKNPFYAGIIEYHKQFTPDFIEQKKNGRIESLIYQHLKRII